MAVSNPSKISLLTNFEFLPSSESSSIFAAGKIQKQYPQMKPIENRSVFTLGGKCTNILAFIDLKLVKIYKLRSK